MANNVIHVGAPPADHQGWEAFTFHIHDFARMDATKNKRVELSSFPCFGHEWILVLYPRGNAVAKDGRMSVFLHNVSEEDAGEISVSIVVSTRDAFGRFAGTSSSSLTGTFRTDSEFTDSWGFDDYFDRDDVLRPTANVLRHGTLTLDLSMQLATKWENPIHTPHNPFSKNMLKLYLEDDTADVAFAARGRLFPAHRAILKSCAPTLAELCQSCNNTDKPVPIPDDVEPEIFCQLLFYVYGGTIPASEFEYHAIDFIEAADKYDVVNLKMEAEIEYVARVTFAVDSVVETLLYADAKHLALLKEAAMDFIFNNAKEMLASDSFKSISPEQSILSELLSLVAMKNDENNGALLRCEDDMEYTSMSVNDLRWALSKRGSDVDGSREMLVARLEHSRADIVRRRGET